MTGWPSQVLGHVGDEAVLADHHDDVLGAEHEAGQVGPVDSAPPPLGRYRSVDRELHAGAQGLVSGDDLVEAPLTGLEEERGLLPRAVAGEQLLVLRAPVDHDGPGLQGHAASSSRSPVGAGSGWANRASTGGEQVRGDGEVADVREVAGQLLEGQAEQRAPCSSSRYARQLGRLGVGLGLPDQSGRVGRRRRR